MMKYVFSLIVLFVVFNSYGQVSGNIAAVTYGPKTDTVAEALVAMALQGPQIKYAEDMAEASKYNLKRSKTLWMNNISAQGNLNEFTINEGSTYNALKQNTIYPRYNFGVVIPLGIFINSPKQVKIDANQYLAAQDQVNIEKNRLRTQVLTLYQDYLMNKNLKELQIPVISNYEIVYLKTEEKFKNGQVSLETFNNASNFYNTALIREANYEREMAVAKSSLEVLIGMDLDDAINLIKNQNKDKNQH